MSKKISELPSATSLTGTEEIPIVQTGTTKKVDRTMLINDYTEYINEITSLDSHLSLRSGALQYIRKIGNMVYLNLSLNYTAGLFSSGGKTLFEVPADITPTGSVYFVPNAVDYSAKFNVWLTNEGAMRIYVPTAQTGVSGTLYFSASYFVS